MAVSLGSLRVGQAYYRLAFVDAERTVPTVESMVYVGMDVFPDEDPDSTGMHYFQDASSFRICGSAAGADYRPDEEIEPLVYRVQAEDAGDSLLDLEGLIAALAEARQRAVH